MKKIIKIFGLYHSGTNVLSFLLKYNFNHYVCRDLFGWKHSYIHNLNFIKKLSEHTKDDVCSIVCIRDPYDWLWRFSQNPYEYYLKDLKSTTFISNSFSNEHYQSAVDMYNKKLENYKNFIEQNNSMLIKYEDLLSNQTEILTNIKEKFNLDKTYDNIIPFYKTINSDEIIEGQSQKLYYKCYKNNFSLEDIDFINNNLDKEILKYFGYNIK